MFLYHKILYCYSWNVCQPYRVRSGNMFYLFML